MQIVDIRRVSCEQMICKEKVGRCYLGDKSVLRPKTGAEPFGVAQVFPERWVRKAQGPTPQPMPFLVLCARVYADVCVNVSVSSLISPGGVRIRKQLF